MEIPLKITSSMTQSIEKRRKKVVIQNHNKNKTEFKIKFKLYITLSDLTLCPTYTNTSRSSRIQCTLNVSTHMCVY